MEEKINLLLNQAIQKFLKLAKCAREKQAFGKPDEDEFCLLTRLYAAIQALQNHPELTYDQFRELEKNINQIGGRDNFPYRPVVQLPSVQPAPRDPQTAIDEIRNQLEEIRQLINYEPPTLQLDSLDLAPGTYEIGYGLFQTDIRWIANKKPLTFITLDWPADPDSQTVNLSGIAPDITIDLRAIMPLHLRVHGFYNDAQAYKGQHLYAEDELIFRSAWPFYWGKGPANAIDDPATRNAFIRSLNKVFELPEYLEENLGVNEYLWLFFPYTGIAKQFWTENGAISGSYKGTLDGFQTQSMVDNNLAGGAEYGIVRFDEDGIGHVIVWVRDMPYPDITIQEPDPVPAPAPEPAPDVTEYEPLWSDLICVQINQ